jgi:hypothetical protein
VTCLALLKYAAVVITSLQLQQLLPLHLSWKMASESVECDPCDLT